MAAKVIVLVLILVVWTVLVSASAHAARADSEEARDQQPRANVTRIVVGAASTQEDGECESPRPNWMRRGLTGDRGERAVCPNV
jgi:outer membrane lipoprotein-sorting protein